MSEVKRYEMKTTYRGNESWDSLEEDKDGGYVNYEDYAALEAKCASLAAENAWMKAGILQASEDMEAHMMTMAYSAMTLMASKWTHYYGFVTLRIQ